MCLWWRARRGAIFVEAVVVARSPWREAGVAEAAEARGVAAGDEGAAVRIFFRRCGGHGAASQPLSPRKLERSSRLVVVSEEDRPLALIAHRLYVETRKE